MNATITAEWPDSGQRRDEHARKITALAEKLCIGERVACPTAFIKEEQAREYQLERVIMVGMPTVPEQLTIIDTLDGRDMLSLHESLVWCAEHESSVN